MACRRGTTNSNRRGSSEDRRRRREWLVQTYRADVDMGMLGLPTGVPLGTGVPACRCYRCGCLLTVDTVSPDRIVPGCVKTKEFPKGGTYKRSNIRPACEACQSQTGGHLGNARKRAKAGAR